jgi:hypothetical protein
MNTIIRRQYKNKLRTARSRMYTIKKQIILTDINLVKVPSVRALHFHFYQRVMIIFCTVNVRYYEFSI